MACPGTKVAPHFTPTDWLKCIHTCTSASEHERDQSHQIRQQGRWLMNESEVKSRWGQHDSNVRLAVRIDDLNRWRETLERTQGELDREIAMLSMAKEQAERALQDMTLPHEVNKQCLILRDRRQKCELIKDAVQKELIKEAKLIQDAKDQFARKTNEAFDQLCILQEIHGRVSADLQDKRVALAIDCDQLHMDCRAPNKNYKPDATRIPKGSVSHEQWLDNSRCNVLSSQTEIRNSQRLRESIYNCILQTDNDLMAQKESTEYEFRKRMHEMSQAIDELQWQKANLENEINDMEKQLENLFDAKQNKICSLKVAQSRMENRIYRPNKELCIDDAHTGLTSEVNNLTCTIEAIEEMICNSRGKLNALHSTLTTINDSIRDKMVAQQLDQQCMEERLKLPVTAHKFDDTDRRLELIGINRAMPETHWLAASSDPSIRTGHWNMCNPNINLRRTSWELGRTDPVTVTSELGQCGIFGKSGLHGNATMDKLNLV